MNACFSTEVVDLNHQAPNRNKRESKYFWDELYTLIDAGDFHSIEIPYEPKWDFGGRSGIPRSMRSLTIKFGTASNYMKHLASFGINCVDCIHLDPTLFCSGPADMYFNAFIHFTLEALEMAKGTNTKVLTLSVTPPIFAVRSLLAANPGMTEEAFLSQTARVIDTVAAAAQAAEITLCIKNEYWGLVRGEKVLPFLASLNEKVMIDADTAHLQIAGIEPAKFILAAKNHIGIVHFTDTAFKDDQETYASPLPEFPALGATKVFRDIGDGAVNFKAVMDALKCINYDGTIVYNCRNSYDICRSILRTRYFINHALT